MKVTDEQKKVIDCQDKLVVVYAAPGSGKTTTVVAKAQTIRTKDKVLITTFTRKCRNEIESRVGKGTFDVVTLHGLCLRVIKQNWQFLGEILGSTRWPEQPMLIFNLEEEIDLIKEIYPDKVSYYSKLLKFFRRLKMQPSTALLAYDSGMYFAGYKRSDLMEFFTYESMRKLSGVLIPEDLIHLANKLLKFPRINHEFYDSYSHVIVDEFQDIDSEQWSLLEPFLPGRQQMIVIGDLNQAIFGFNGGNGVVFKFLLNHPQATKFPLSFNFRSKQRIVNLANHIKPSSNMTPINAFQGTTYFKEFTDIHDEAMYLFELGEDLVILARTNSYLEKLKPYLPGRKLMTIHQAKGKEWNKVAIAGVQQGILPLVINRNQEEEENLFYVGCTRAKSSLYLTCSGPKSYLLTDLIQAGKITEEAIIEV